MPRNKSKTQKAKLGHWVDETQLFCIQMTDNERLLPLYDKTIRGCARHG